MPDANPADPVNQQTSQTIPKARFDEIYGKLKEMERANAALAQQYGVQDLSQLPQAIEAATQNAMGEKFLQIVRDSGTAPQFASYFQQVGVDIPEIQQMASQMQVPQGQQGMPDENDPYLQQLEKLKRQQAEMAAWKQQMEMQQTQTKAQQLRAQMEESIKAKNPNISPIALESAVQWMTQQAQSTVAKLQAQGVPPSEFMNKLDFGDMAGKYVTALQESFGIASPEGQAPVDTQAGQEQNPFGGQSQQPVTPSTGPTPPDEDAALDAREQELLDAAVSTDGG